ncbi:MAG: serine hydrolase [Pseudomonadota bacterium]
MQHTGSLKIARPTRRQAIVGALSACAAPGAPARSDGQFDTVLRAADALDQLRAIVIAGPDGILAERAVRGPGLDRPANVKSVSKTIVALLTGIVIARGALPGVGATLGEVAPSLIPPNADPRVAEIRLADLLTMQARLERTSGANYGGWIASPDWVADALSRPMVAEPGARFLYSTGSFHVLGAVLAEATGQTLLALARDWLGDPVGIEIPAWTRDPQGRFLGGNNMALTPRALARIGQCVLAGGRWQGRAVIPGAWLARSWQARTRSPWSGHAYGYGWFLAELGGEPVRYARGYGGQMLYVLPDRGLTVAITSDTAGPERGILLGAQPAPDRGDPAGARLSRRGMSQLRVARRIEPTGHGRLRLSTHETNLAAVRALAPIRGGAPPESDPPAAPPSSARPGPLRIWGKPESHCCATRTC